MLKYWRKIKPQYGYDYYVLKLPLVDIVVTHSLTKDYWEVYLNDKEVGHKDVEKEALQLAEQTFKAKYQELKSKMEEVKIQ